MILIEFERRRFAMIQNNESENVLTVCIQNMKYLSANIFAKTLYTIIRRLIISNNQTIFFSIDNIWKFHREKVNVKVYYSNSM